MATTSNYNLYVTDDASVRFQTWRREVAGATNSNMHKIDAALGGKADMSGHISATLLQSGWAGVEAPFTQTISVSGLKADQNGEIAVAQSATYEQRQAAREAQLAIIGQQAGSLTIAADGELPDMDIPVDIVLLG